MTAEPIVYDQSRPMRQLSGTAPLVDPPGGEELEALLADAEQQVRDLGPVVELLEQRDDPDAREALKDVRRELDHAAAEVVRVTGELACCAASSAEQAAAARREAAVKIRTRGEAMQRARDCQARREAAARRFDQRADELAGAVREWLDVCDQQDNELRAAGRGPGASAPRMRLFAAQAAFALATRDIRGVLQLEATFPPGQLKRLADADVRPVEKSSSNGKGGTNGATAKP